MLKIFYQISYPYLWLIVIVIVSAIYAWFFYRADRKKDSFSRPLLIFLVFLRFLSAAVLAFFLLKPIIERVSKRTEKPLVLMVQDNSKSIRLAEDSAFIKTAYPEQWKDLSERLGNDYQILNYTLGSEIKLNDSLSFNEEITDLSSLSREILPLLNEDQIAALVFSSDGIFNQGMNPIYKLSEYQFPIYTIGMGDPEIRSDIYVNQFIANQYAFVGNDFPISLSFGAKNMKGSKLKINLKEQGKIIESQELNIEDEESIHELDFKIQAAESGLKRYKIEILSDKQELNNFNNSSELVVEVLDKKQRVLILAVAPHPDLSALRDAIERDGLKEVKIIHDPSEVQDLDQYNLLVLHQFPTISESLEDLVSQASKLSLPICIIAGSKTDVKKVNQMGFGEIYDIRKGEDEQVQGLVNSGFSLFNLEDEVLEKIKEWPPLLAPFSRLKIYNPNHVLLYQTIQSLDTDYPLIAFYSNDNQKLALVSGEGLWRWKLGDYKQSGNHQAFESLIRSSVEYLAVKLKKERLIVNYENLHYADEAIEFFAELYNPAYEQVFGQDLMISIFDSENKEYNYQFSLSNGKYYLNAGSFPPGDYRFVAKAEQDNEPLEVDGRFSIIQRELEQYKLEANHNLLQELSAQSKGKFYLPENMMDISEDIINDQGTPKLVIEEKEKFELIEWKWFFFLVLAMLTIEWFIRKYQGAY